ncbi:MAG: hypothetical protein QM764_01920 [Chitinophagaceae bacterium]
MPCNLVILGKNLDIDALIAKSSLRGYSKRYKGQPVFKTKPNGKKSTHSSIRIQTSKSDFDNLEKQISDTIKYLKRHKNKLNIIRQTKEVDLAVLDFGICLRINKKEILTQSDRFPNQLLKLAGDIGLDIELSIYPIELQEILETRSARKKRKVDG